MSSNFSLPTQFEINAIKIDGEDVIGLFQSISIFENIYSPVITGSIVLMDSDFADFIQQYEIEGNEEIEFEFTNALDEILEFKGILNGLRNKASKNQRTLYTFDFTSDQVRINEGIFITNKFDSKSPEEIVKDMIKQLEGKEDKVQGKGKPMTFIGSRRRPTKVIEHVLTHGVAEGKSKPSNTEKGKSRDEETKGTTGFLCWQTLDGYRFSSIDEVLEGTAGEDAGTKTHQVQNKSLDMQTVMESIIDYDFKMIGDTQTKQRSGAFKNTVVSMDLDKGLYKEYTYEDEKNLTEKQKKINKSSTRIMVRPYMNEHFEDSCTIASKDTWDQSRQFLAQNQVRQNTFADQFGNFVFPPRFEVRAGDVFEAKIPKVQSEGEAGYNEKHSGRYVISQVGHHMLSDGRAYTKVQTIRSTIQQDDTTSEKS